MRLLTRRPTRLTAGQAMRSVMAAGDPIGAFGESTTVSGSGSGSDGGGRTTTMPFSAAAVRFGHQRPTSTPRPLVLTTTGSTPVGLQAPVGASVAMVSGTAASAAPAAPAAPDAQVAQAPTREAEALPAPVATTQSKSMADIYGVFLSDDEGVDAGGDASGVDPLQSALPPSRHIAARRRRRRRRVSVATPSPIKRPRVVSRDTAAAVLPKEPLHDDPDCLVLSVHLISGGRRTRAAAAAAVAQEDVPAVSEDSPSESDDSGVHGGVAVAGGVASRVQHRWRASDAAPATGRTWWTPRVPSQGDSVGDEDAFIEVLGSGRAAQETARRRRLRLATPPPTVSSAPIGLAGRGEGGGCAGRPRRLTRVRPAASLAAVAPNPVRRLRFGEDSDASGGDESDALGGGSGGGGSGGGGGETDSSSVREDLRRAPTAVRAAPMRLTFSLLQSTAGGDSSGEEGETPPAARHPRSPSPPRISSELGGDGAIERSDRVVASAAAGHSSPPRAGVACLYARLSRNEGSSPSGRGRQRAGTSDPALGGVADPRGASSLARPVAVAVDSPSLPELSPSPGGTIGSQAVVLGTTAAGGRRHVLPLPPDQWTWRGRQMTPSERAAVEFLTTGRVRSGGALPPGIDGAAPIAVTVAAARITLRRRDLRLLRGERWLNDEIMNAYVALLNERNQRRVVTAKAATAAAAACGSLAGNRLPPPPSPPPLRVYCFNTFFYLRLTQGPDRFDYDGVARWTVKAGVDAAATDLLLVPVHVDACHWVLVSLDVRSRRVTYLDPLHAADSSGVTATLSRWLAAEVAAHHGGTPTEAAIGVPAAWTVTANTVEGVAAPRQADAGSCGVYVLAMAERLERGAPLVFGQRDIRLLRKQMVLDLYDGKVV